MKYTTVKKFTNYTFIIFIIAMPFSRLIAQTCRIEKTQALFDSLKVKEIQCPKTVLAVAIYETGWLECDRCSYQLNNLFGFKLRKGYIRFTNISECIDYLKKWQNLYYETWRVKHPDGTYHQFMYYIRYARNMENYNRNLKSIEYWITENIKGAEEE